MGSGGGPSLPCLFFVRELRAKLARSVLDRIYKLSTTLLPGP